MDYSNAVFRLMENLKVPRQGLIGPWSHKYPHIAVPGPAIGFLQEALRWWDHWLKGIDRGVMEEPVLPCLDAGFSAAHPRAIVTVPGGGSPSHHGHRPTSRPDLLRSGVGISCRLMSMPARMSDCASARR